MHFPLTPSGSSALRPLAVLIALSAACSTSPSDPVGTPAIASGGNGGGANGAQGGGAGLHGGNGGAGPSTGGAMMTSGGSGAGGTSAGGANASSGGSTSGGSTNAGGAIATGGTSAAGGTGGTGGAAAGGPALGDDCGATPAGEITFSVPSSAFEGSLSVELRTAIAGAEIRFTTDRSVPTETSTLYSGTPIPISSTTRLIARPFVQGVAAGPPQSATYVARAFEQMHDLPVIVLDTYGTPIPGQDAGGKAGDEYIDTALLAFEPNAGMTSFAATPKVASAAGVRVRGQLSSNYGKKPYKVELHEADGTDRDCAMLGMPSESDWVLHSPFPDKALIRNVFVYSLGREIGMAAPRAMFAEVYLNTAARAVQATDYVGVYLLVENIKNQKDRLNLQQLEPADTVLPAIAGGYIFKFEWRVTEIEQTLPCPSGQQNCWEYLEVSDRSPGIPSSSSISPSICSAFVGALHSAAPSDEASGYPAFLDVRSFATQVVLHELTRNLDAYTRSQYFFKDRDGKINAGPLWDYDLIAGVGFQNTGLSTEGWQHESMASRFTNTADWFPLLIADPAFKSAVVVARWKELRQAQLSDAQVRARIESLTAGLAAGAQRNLQKWDNLTTARIGMFDTPTVATGTDRSRRCWIGCWRAWRGSTLPGSDSPGSPFSLSVGKSIERNRSALSHQSPNRTVPGGTT